MTTEINIKSTSGTTQVLIGGGVLAKIFIRDYSFHVFRRRRDINGQKTKKAKPKDRQNSNYQILFHFFCPIMPFIPVYRLSGHFFYDIVAEV